MAISVSSDINAVMDRYAKQTAANSAAAGLEKKLKGDLSNATDEELMDVCKSFEAYLLEHVLKDVKEAIVPKKDENPYLNMFGDNLYQEYSKMIAERGDLGIAQKLFDSMKRNTPVVKNDSTESTVK
ncbi:MAG: rod-binding protein [Lachnospiraceae bacterium]|nr:rod-binding protein [Lachnospiraceae bacterium]